MAGTARNYNSNLFNIGPGDLWVVDVPAAGSTITLATDGTPDSTAHPTAKHFGHTDAGSTFKSTQGSSKIYADEQIAPVRLTQDDATVTLTTTLLQVSDPDLLILLSPGQTTKFTSTGKVGVTGGTIPLVYLSVALIYPTIADPTKFEVIQLYKCINTAGIEKLIQRKGIAKAPVTFEGQAISSRAATDTTFANWKQT